MLRKNAQKRRKWSLSLWLSTSPPTSTNSLAQQSFPPLNTTLRLSDWHQNVISRLFISMCFGRVVQNGLSYYSLWIIKYSHASKFFLNSIKSIACFNVYWRKEYRCGHPLLFSFSYLLPESERKPTKEIVACKNCLSLTITQRYCTIFKQTLAVPSQLRDERRPSFPWIGITVFLKCTHSLYASDDVAKYQGRGKAQKKNPTNDAL